MSLRAEQEAQSMDHPRVTCRVYRCNGGTGVKVQIKLTLYGDPSSIACTAPTG